MPMPLSLNNPVGSGQANDPDDVYALDTALREIDVYDPPPEYADEPQRYATAPMNEALERFQQKEGLKVDGYSNPGGPTERAINNKLLGNSNSRDLLLIVPMLRQGETLDIDALHGVVSALLDRLCSETDSKADRKTIYRGILQPRP